MVAGPLSHDSSVLVINVARIGDTLLVTPVLRAVKAACPDGRLGCLAHPKRAAVLEALPFLDELGTITPKRARWHARLLRGRHWDFALVYGQDAELLRYAERVADKVVAFEQEDKRLNRLLWKTVPRPSQPIHAVRERLLLLDPLGIGTPDLRLAYEPTAPERESARTWLEMRLGTTAFPLVGFQMFSFPTKSYRDWPEKHFLRLGRRLLKRFPDAGLLVLGGKENRHRGARVVEDLGPRAINAAGLLDLRQAGAIISHLELYVGVDTGPTHMAGALGIPMIALYHCLHSGRLFAPLNDSWLRVIEHPCPESQCSPCTPMSDIGVKLVWEQACCLLRKGPAREQVARLEGQDAQKFRRADAAKR